jgi:hypothetical protein
MVFMPSEIAVRILSREKTRDGDVVSFEVHSAEGGPAIRDGLVMLHA